jgi:hypothetical protein
MATLAPPIRFADAKVFHARLRPHGLRFRYGVVALFVDIDRYDQSPRIPFFSVRRFNLYGFDPADHGPRDGSALRDYVDRLHARANWPRPHQVVLTCFPRILGYVFNPLATYTCTDDEGRIVSIIYEVRNTFGEHHSYLFRVRNGEQRTVEPHECDKLFYVSPFLDMALRYRFLMEPPRNGQFSLKIIERDRHGVVLTALMRASEFAPTRAALLGRIAATPLAGFKILAGIHWQALRLWLRGHRPHPRPAPPQAISNEAPGAYSLGEPKPSILPLHGLGFAQPGERKS